MPEDKAQPISPLRNSRRRFLKSTVAAAATVGFPTILPSYLFGQNAPSNRINIGAIGVGRISRGHDLPGTWKFDQAQIMAVCDLDEGRVAAGRTLLNGVYAKKTGKPYTGTAGYSDYRELLANKDIDAVIISTPDHQHARLAVAAVHAGKDVYLQKPASLTIAEGRAMVNAVQKSGRILQIGSQQRSWKQFRRACELVRNGRIGEITHVEIGLPGDPSGGDPTPMPVPYGFNYDAWLGSTPEVPYTLDRVMPVKGFDRPGWLRCEQFGAGMITGWGAHHVDTAHWGMNTELTGPVEVWGEAEFPKSGLWDVHGAFKTHAIYANGMTMTISGEFQNGIKFYGTKGWIFVCRDEQATPTAAAGQAAAVVPLVASDPKILDSVIGPNEIHLYYSEDQHGNWLDCIRSRKEPIAPAEIGHRACSTCLIHHIAMKTKRRLHWDPAAERFKNDDDANSRLSRPQRVPYILPV
ncbi:Predicted dehydrogenase [Granulicella pectinivorans]|jgi:predicted dehydrogenase|uniref:Predicted dehydrogenase n=1 Tax=Granulicella pectinivorans TaxID=474950 RepID=A0A1I6MBC3_9BACT|nr:Gfo/Idh/MocA family oxidoreductase [Granulicella pectinivorans]SFS13005.1 Predicted dehydrogenase [Granulicella pectinivorans]